MDEDFEDLMGGDFVFYARATGTVDNEDGADYDVCSSDSKNIEIIDEDDFVILDNINLVEKTACGTSVQLTADVWNIGDEDQEDVYVVVYNKELGINEEITIGDIDKFEDKELNVLLDIPTDAEEGMYYLDLYVFDEDDDIFENSNDDEAEFTKEKK